MCIPSYFSPYNSLSKYHVQFKYSLPYLQIAFKKKILISNYVIHFFEALAES